MYAVTINGKQYIITTGYKTRRRYFKTINVPEKTKAFIQPTLTANGTMGVDAFAVSSSGWKGATSSLAGDIYFAFDSNTENYYRGKANNGWIQFYSKAPIKVNNIRWSFFWAYPTGGTVQGSENGVAWETIKSWSNNVDEDFTISVNSSKYFKYYKINISGTNQDVIHCKGLQIYAVEQLEAGYTYDEEVSANEVYDYYKDETYLERLGVEI